MKGIYFSFVLLLLVSSCDDTDVDSVEYYNVSTLASDNQNKKIKNLEFEVSKIDSTLNSSYIGDLLIKNEKLYFSDKYFNYVFQLDDKGNLVNTFLGKGPGPNEINDLDDIVANEDGSFTVLSSETTSLHNYDNSWRIIDKNIIDFQLKRSYSEVMENPEPSLPESYELETGYDDIMKYWDEKYVAMAVNATHPKFNGYFDTDLFYKHSRILALINKKTGIIEEFIGRRSPVYLTKNNIPNFNHFRFQCDEKHVYVTFMPDAQIYIIDKNTKRAIGKFGEPGIDMKTNYRQTMNYEEAQKNELEDLSIYGYYNDLKVFTKQNLIFRTYTKSKESNSDGLQVYKNYDLIGDLSVPKGFRIVGMLNNSFIGTIKRDIINDQAIKIIKIKFNYEN